ncbi:hypothetical protein EAX61_11575 [Dokdonia sinensis]|uniref:Uncharacterized protein n=1 Tax=Dokdonia sinensis TaxID=2479847 RepID=A0A3M0G8K3_9FLAO|nr:hypothetical protein [Dokdonia sinensis]RMB57379.1 hypothetical protein EAX61_11575 [Dokdonia sinensis]
MKSKLLLLAFTCLFAFTSCSDDDSVPNNTLAGDNGFEFEKTAYITDLVFIDEDNNIVLSNRNLTTEGDEEGHFVIFSTKNGNLNELTYTVGQKLEKCNAIVSGRMENGVVQGADVLGQENTEKGFMRIVNFNNFDQEIDIIFEFTRTDGKLVSGSYIGNFQRL